MKREGAADGFAEVVERNVLLCVSGSFRWLQVVSMDLAVRVAVGQGSFLSSPVDPRSLFSTNS